MLTLHRWTARGPRARLALPVVTRRVTRSGRKLRVACQPLALEARTL